ncbi:hypothetical protein [Dermabacter sp. Marseille-Q3180]|uniref:hypothetical protein n=1 Tax=Dermabacter sp. Marseille-Q3180 TaxID=2758090 RepID=UPI0020240351|nr:hypothetical protein [Dermabacter sp. Marseille-Q3180]
MNAPPTKISIRNHAGPSRVWVLLSSIAFALLVLAPGVGVALLLFPVFIEDPPNTMPAFRGVNTLTYTVVRSVLVCVVAALAANVLVMFAAPAVVRAIKRCPTPSAARFGTISAIVFGAGLLLNAAVWGLALGPFVLSFFPALQGASESLGNVSSQAFEKLPLLSWIFMLGPFFVDWVRFLVMLIAGIAVSTARLPGTAMPTTTLTAQGPR